MPIPLFAPRPNFSNVRPRQLAALQREARRTGARARPAPEKFVPPPQATPPGAGEPLQADACSSIHLEEA